MIMLMLIVGAAIWFGTLSGLRSESMQIEMRNEHIRELKRIKERMLTFAVMQPEIYYSETSGTIPGIGYFPCPDTDGDGMSNSGPTYPCGNNKDKDEYFVTGMVPVKADENRFTFIDKPLNSNRYWYSVDSRFAPNNKIIASHRYLPLNAGSPTNANLTLDGRTDIVMVLIYAGDPLSGQSHASANIDNIENFLDQGNSDDDENFFTKDGGPDVFNDFVISITREEWRAAVLSRASKDLYPEDEIPDLCTEISSNVAHWFNRCLFNSTPIFRGNDNETETDIDKTCDFDFFSADENTNGQNWREFFNCPPNP